MVGGCFGPSAAAGGAAAVPAGAPGAFLAVTGDGDFLPVPGAPGAFFAAAGLGDFFGDAAAGALPSPAGGASFLPGAPSGAAAGAFLAGDPAGLFPSAPAGAEDFFAAGEGDPFFAAGDGLFLAAAGDGDFFGPSPAGAGLAAFFAGDGEGDFLPEPGAPALFLPVPGAPFGGTFFGLAPPGEAAPGSGPYLVVSALISSPSLPSYLPSMTSICGTAFGLYCCKMASTLSRWDLGGIVSTVEKSATKTKRSFAEQGNSSEKQSMRYKKYKRRRVRKMDPAITQ